MLGLVKLIKQTLQIKKLSHENQILIAEHNELQEELSALSATQPAAPSLEEEQQMIEPEI
jgi:hypothetical protein